MFEQEPEAPAPGTGNNDDSKLKEIIARELAQSEGYKGLQRAFNKKIEADAREREALLQELAAVKAANNGVAEGMNYLSGKFMEVVPDDTRAEIVAELERKRVANMEAQIADMRQALNNQRRQPDPPQQQNDLDEEFKALEQEVVDSLREAAQELGIDPNDKRLDYGTPGAKFAQRLKALTKTAREIRSAKDEADIDSVRQRVSAPPARTSGGAAVTPSNGKSFLELGTEEIWNKLQAGQLGARRKR